MDSDHLTHIIAIFAFLPSSLDRVTIIGSLKVAVPNVGDLKMAKIAANRAESCVLPSRQFEIDQ